MNLHRKNSREILKLMERRQNKQSKEKCTCFVDLFVNSFFGYRSISWANMQSINWCYSFNIFFSFHIFVPLLLKYLFWAHGFYSEIHFYEAIEKNVANWQNEWNGCWWNQYGSGSIWKSKTWKNSYLGCQLNMHRARCNFAIFNRVEIFKFSLSSFSISFSFTEDCRDLRDWCESDCVILIWWFTCSFSHYSTKIHQGEAWWIVE